MKQLTLIGIAVLFSLATSAQTIYSVPELTDQQKLKVAKGLCYNNIITAISFAKSKGFSGEEYAKYVGELIKSFYTQMDFDGVVKDQLQSWAAMAGTLVILNQSDKKVVLRCSQIYPALETQGPFWNVSFAEMMKWLEMLYAMGCETIGISYSMNINEEGVDITIAKK